MLSGFQLYPRWVPLDTSMTLSAMICKRYSPVIILTVKFLMIYNYKETSLTLSSTVLIV